MRKERRSTRDAREDYQLPGQGYFAFDAQYENGRPFVGCTVCAHIRAGLTMSLKEYLQKHFVDKATFASLADMPLGRLDELIAAEAVPAATYTCNGRSISSAAFGTIEIAEHLTGEYFRPECVRWATIAAQAPLGSERASVAAVLTNELRAALGGHFQDSAVLEEKVSQFLPAFWNGTFGLCVADPSSGAGIARKEILQERLTAITGNGSNSHPRRVSKQALLALMDAYADAAMPFSPAEYDRSSRKRLVDDLRPIVAAGDE